MRRAPIVLTATVAGLALVLGVHPRSQLKTVPPAATVTAPPVAGQEPATASQTVVGSDETINDGATFGDLQVRVTASGGRITSVGMAKLNISGPQSQQITDNVIPQLEQETLAAQSANIQGVSGATYTSQAYQASLQAALDRLAAQS
jgi:uncharacterized protein with FMN-binding domain